MSQSTNPTMVTRKQTNKTQQQKQEQQQSTDAKPTSSPTPPVVPSTFTKNDRKPTDDETDSDTSESETSEEEWPNNKSARSIKVPQFNKDDPEVWFIQVEAAFFVGHVKKEKEQYMHVLANLSSEAMISVRDLVGKPYSTGDYRRLKNNLIKRFSLTPTEKIRMVLDKIEQRSSERPSAFFRRLTAAAGEDIKYNVVLERFVGKLNSNVSNAISVMTETLIYLYESSNKEERKEFTRVEETDTVAAREATDQAIISVITKRGYQRSRSISKRRSTERIVEKRHHT